MARNLLNYKTNRFSDKSKPGATRRRKVTDPKWMAGLPKRTLDYYSDALTFGKMKVGVYILPGIDQTLNGTVVPLAKGEEP